MGDALTSHSPQLVWALPTTGKTTNLPTAIAETGLPTTILTQRGRVEKYDEIKERCMAAGLQPKILPNFFERCPCASGAFGEDLADLYEALYTGGVSPREIHAFADYHGIPTPCQDNGRCPYSAAWDFDLAEYDVLIGHPTHAYVPSVVHGRAIVYDEFIGAAYTTQLGNTDRRPDTFDGDLQDAVTVALNRRDGLPFDSYSDLLANRDAPPAAGGCARVVRDEHQPSRRRGDRRRIRGPRSRPHGRAPSSICHPCRRAARPAQTRSISLHAPTDVRVTRAPG
jgi:hypothetical protein